jgi:hypothetical protein
MVHAYGEFAPLTTFIESMPGGPMVNLASSNEHVPEIKRWIRVVKERCRATQHSLLFQRLPKVLMIHIVFHAVKLLNFFLTTGGNLDTLSPRTIMSGETLDYKKHLCLQLGQYCQVHKEDAPHNRSLHPRMKGGISLGPSSDFQGGFKFMALNTGKKIIQRSWDVIPMPETVITRVNTFGNNQPEQLIFTNRHGRLIGDTNDADIPGVDFDDDDDDDEIPGVDIVKLPGVDVAAQDAEEKPAPQIVEIDDLDIPVPDPPPVEIEAVAATPVDQTPVAQPAETQGARRSTRIMTQTKAHEPSLSTSSRYSYAVTQLESEGLLNPDAHMFVQEDFYQAEPDVVVAVMLQLSLKSGLKEWGDKAYSAVESKMKQSHFSNTFKPKHWSKLTDT